MPTRSWLSQFLGAKRASRASEHGRMVVVQSARATREPQSFRNSLGAGASLGGVEVSIPLRSARARRHAWRQMFKSDRFAEHVPQPVDCADPLVKAPQPRLDRTGRHAQHRRGAPLARAVQGRTERASARPYGRPRRRPRSGAPRWRRRARSENAPFAGGRERRASRALAAMPRAARVRPTFDRNDPRRRTRFCARGSPSNLSFGVGVRCNASAG